MPSGWLGPNWLEIGPVTGHWRPAREVGPVRAAVDADELEPDELDEPPLEAAAAAATGAGVGAGGAGLAKRFGLGIRISCPMARASGLASLFAATMSDEDTS